MKNKYTQSDGFIPKITFKNSWIQFLIALILVKPVSLLIGLILIFVLNIAFGIHGVVEDTMNFSFIVSFLLLVEIARRSVLKREIRKHWQEMGIKNK